MPASMRASSTTRCVSSSLRTADRVNLPSADFLDGLGNGLKGLRIACSTRLGFVEKLDPIVEEATLAAARLFESLGASVEFIDPPLDDTAPLIVTIVGDWVK